LHSLRYHFYVVDTSGNWNKTEYITVGVLDNDDPEFIEDLTDSAAFTGSTIDFEVNVSDNVGIQGVFVVYWFGENPPDIINETMTLTAGGPPRVGIFSLYDVHVPRNSLESIHYYFVSMDSSGNWNRSQTASIEVIDNILPTLIEDLTPSSGTTGETFTFTFTVGDNIGIKRTELEYWFSYDLSSFTNQLLVEGPPGKWSQTIVIPIDATGTIRYNLQIYDDAENRNQTVMTSVPIHDNDRPEIGRIPDPREIVKGLPILLGINVEDNIEVISVHLEYWFGNEESVNITTSNDPYEFTVAIPREPSGDLHYFFAAVDGAGNWNSTDLTSITPVNPAPEVQTIPLWVITEGTDADLDLTPYLSDENDETLTVECSDDSVTVDGLTLKLRHDVAVPDRTVTLTVSDGEDETGVTLNIHVVNVNDLPFISDLLPADGTEFKKGKTIVFSATTMDEDGDTLTITWKDGEEVLGTGSPFEFSSLSKGEHTITVLVDDGSGVTEKSFTINVKEEEESPGFLFVGIILAITIAAVVAARRRD
ncbi:MAG: hypothetical protein GQ558_11030, partial [Thermoplasmata archaeon]|nr:hypothetical protein [Thermoplasmata archaeon]